MSRTELTASRWLEAHTDRGADLFTLPRNAILTDVSGSGDFHLVITDLKLDKETKSRLKVYKGTMLISDQALPNMPCSVVSFYGDYMEPRIPVIAVASGSELFLYKNLKPFYKFKLPFCPLIQEESDIWSQIALTKEINVDKLIGELKKIPYSSLSARSQHLLNLASPSEVEELIRKLNYTSPNKENIITCMTTLEKSTHEKSAVSCPVLATEYGNIFILDPQNFAILYQANTCNVKSIPSVLQSSGLYDVEFRLLIATRERHICLLRKGWLEGKSLIHLKSDIVDMVLIPGDNLIVVATADHKLQCFTKRGQKLWLTELTDHISCLCLVSLQHLSAHFVAVGLLNGSIQLYHGRNVVDNISVSDAASVIAFGQLGQEENVMVVITMGGAINFKILKRTADFSLKTQETNAVVQSKPLPLPKRSKLFLEQSIRERQNFLEIHQSFQQDLIRLRLTAARALVQNLSDQSGVGNEKEQIKLSAQVLGLGPKFTIILSLENINPKKPLLDLSVTFHVNPAYYVLSTYVMKVPLVPPSLSYKMETKVKEVQSTTQEEDVEVEKSNFRVIRVFVTRLQICVPVLAATINMPPTELLT
ncbi:Bardet-Biedl syndrome 1 protein homolog [Anthonomus grandis grandis]|uniref:Bardet-Biedl syndrome 1 protein homolog n=1 Tax=Anthonomus grandis grandis TaxID=2921223 RepID=UPI002165DBC5|nr:Bardet-Biedl syndrome 1 protein homolog [Anthonomus grandis grandis]